MPARFGNVGSFVKGIAAILVVMAGAAVVSVLHMGSAKAEPIVIRFAHVAHEGAPKGIGAKLLQKRVEERLAGKVVVKVYPRSLKYNDNQVLLRLLLGDIELAAPSFSKFRSFTKKIQIFDVPFLFKDLEAVHRFQAGPAGRELLDSMKDKKLKGLTFWDNGFRVISARRPIRLPADLKGLVFRIEPSAVIAAQYNAIGVTPIPMPYKDLREAAQVGLINGQENTWSNIVSKGIYDFQRHYTEIDHTFQGYVLVTSDDFWNGLPPDIRATLEEILKEVSVEVNRIAKSGQANARQKVLQTGKVKVTEVTDAEMKVWRETLRPIRQQFEGEIGKALLEAADAANRGG